LIQGGKPLPDNLESGFKLGRVEVKPAENVLLLNGTAARC